MDDDDHQKEPTGKAGNNISSLQLLRFYDDDDDEPTVTPKPLFPIPLNSGPHYSRKRARNSYSDQKPADEDDDADDDLQKAILLSMQPQPTSDSNQYHQIPANTRKKTGRKRARNRWDQTPADVIKEAKKAAAQEDEEEEDDDCINGELQRAILLSVSTSKDSNQNCFEHKTFFDRKLKGVRASPELIPLDYFLQTGPEYFGAASTSACVICGDDQPTGNLASLSDCHHRFCRGCSADFVGESLQEDIDIHRRLCPGKNCKEFLRVKWCRRFIPPEVWRRRWYAAAERLALAEPDVIMCPNVKCWGLFLDDRKGFPIKACPECYKVFCTECRVRFHMGLTCKQYQASLVTVPKPKRVKKRNYRKRSIAGAGERRRRILKQEFFHENPVASKRIIDES